MHLATVLVALQATNPSSTALDVDSAQARLRNPNGQVPPTATAVRIADRAPALDGRLTEALWQTAPATRDFTQVIPNDGAEPSQQTEVQVTYDDGALYICARLFDSDPDAIVGRLGRRDSYTSSDEFSVVIDSYHDHRTSFRFAVNPAGVRSDAVTTNDDSHGDSSWDPVWDAATRIDSLGWVVEMRIPFSQLRFSAEEEQVWGINFTRTIFRNNELVRWSWAPNTDEGYASIFGHLVGLSGIPQPRRLEVLPYSVAKSEFTEGADPADPFNDGSVYGVTGGVDLKYGLTSDLTLDATFNPDFGQVEADPAVVNLSAFESFFSERRPFFVEGANIFRFGAGSGGFIFGAPQLFYSRRIGRAPSRSVSEPDGYVDNPTATSILGAAKLSGKTSGWEIGLLEALTAREYASVQVADGSRTQQPVEPATNYGVLSLRKDFRGGSSGLGVLATSVNRDLRDPVFQALRSSAYSGGVDFFHRFAQSRFVLAGTVSASRIQGEPTAITAAQRSSARYFQRPDQDYVSVDPSATSLTGFAGSVQAGKIAGNWTYGTDLFARSPGFEVNDAGFETQSDRIFHGVRLGRRWLDPGKVFRNFFLNATWAQTWNFGGTAQGRSAYAGAGGQLLNYWNVNLSGNYSLGGLSDRATRGGPLMESPRQWNMSAFVASDYRKPVSLSSYAAYARNRHGGWGTSVGSEIEVRPTGAVSLSLSPSYDKSHSIGFYVTQRADPTATETFGRRYLFSELVQTSVDLTLRMSVALTPNLSIQLYAQPFIAAGDYQRFKELTTPRTYNFLHYGVDGASTLVFDEANNGYTADPDGDGPAAPITFGNPDFRFRSLRSNLVVRWEYSPGSTLFLVWNHGQSGFATDPTLRVFDELGDLFRDDQQNTFLIKLNYWLSL